MRCDLTKRAKAVAPMRAAFKTDWSTPPAAETCAPMRIRLELRVGSVARSTSSVFLDFLAARRTTAIVSAGGEAGVDTGTGTAIDDCGGGGESDDEWERLRLSDMAKARREMNGGEGNVLGSLASERDGLLTGLSSVGRSMRLNVGDDQQRESQASHAPHSVPNGPTDHPTRPCHFLLLTPIPASSSLLRDGRRRRPSVATCQLFHGLNPLARLN